MDIWGFAGDVVSTLIGVAVGSIFSVLIMRWDANRAAEKEAKAEAALNTENLRLAFVAASTNVNSLLAFKEQMIVPMKPDIAAMNGAVATRNPDRIFQVSEPLRHFFQGFPKITPSEFPAHKELGFLLPDVAPFIVFAHKAHSTILELNDRIASRNELITEHGRRNIGDGHNQFSMMYYSQMLLSEAVNIETICDEALAFNDLLSDQISNYAKHRLAPGQFIGFSLPEPLAALMPPKDLLKSYREQMVDVGNASKLPAVK